MGRSAPPSPQRALPHRDLGSRWCGVTQPSHAHRLSVAYRRMRPGHTLWPHQPLGGFYGQRCQRAVGPAAIGVGRLPPPAGFASVVCRDGCAPCDMSRKGVAPALDVPAAVGMASHISHSPCTLVPCLQMSARQRQCCSSLGATAASHSCTPDATPLIPARAVGAECGAVVSCPSAPLGRCVRSAGWWRGHAGCIPSCMMSRAGAQEDVACTSHGRAAQWH